MNKPAIVSAVHVECYITVAFDVVSAYLVQLKVSSTDTTPFSDVPTELGINNDLAMCSSILDGALQVHSPFHLSDAAIHCKRCILTRLSR